ncbi:hypothetical protein D9M69_459720 [compost metagenome]
MQAGGASRHDGVARTLHAIGDGQVAGDQVDQRARHEERRNAPRPLGQVFDLGFFDARQAADARAHDHADAFGVGFGDFKTAIAPCLHPGSQPVMDERIHLAGFLGRDIGADVEVFDFAGNVRGDGRGIETGDAADARTSVDDIVPSGGQVVPHGRNDTQAGDDDTSLHG